MVKPYKGAITNWKRYTMLFEDGLQEVVIGLFGERLIRTSPIVRIENNMLETENSTYKLVGYEVRDDHHERH